MPAKKTIQRSRQQRKPPQRSRQQRKPPQKAGSKKTTTKKPEIQNGAIMIEDEISKSFLD